VCHSRPDINAVESPGAEGGTLETSAGGSEFGPDGVYDASPGTEGAEDNFPEPEAG
jgi:hypothetical protein